MGDRRRRRTWSFRRMRVAIDLGVAALLLVAVAFAAHPARAALLESAEAPERIPTNATVNDAAKGELLVWRDSEGIWVSAADLARLGVPVGGAGMRAIEGEPHARIDQLEGVAAVLEETTLTLAFTVD